MNISIFVISEYQYDKTVSSLKDYLTRSAMLSGTDIELFSNRDSIDIISEKIDSATPLVFFRRGWNQEEYKTISAISNINTKVIYVNHSEADFLKLSSKYTASPVRKSNTAQLPNEMGTRDQDPDPDQERVRVPAENHIQFEYYNPYLFVAAKGTGSAALLPLGIDLSMHYNPSVDSQFVKKRFDVGGFDAILTLLSSSGRLLRKLPQIDQTENYLDYLLSQPVVEGDPLEFINKNICDSRTAEIIDCVAELNQAVDSIDLFINANVVKNISVSYRMLCTNETNLIHLKNGLNLRNKYGDYKIFVVGCHFGLNNLIELISIDMSLTKTLFLYNDIYIDDVRNLVGGMADSFIFYDSDTILSEITRLQDGTTRQIALETKIKAFSSLRSDNIKQLLLTHRDHIFDLGDAKQPCDLTRSLR